MSKYDFLIRIATKLHKNLIKNNPTKYTVEDIKNFAKTNLELNNENEERLYEILKGLQSIEKKSNVLLLKNGPEFNHYPGINQKFLKKPMNNNNNNNAENI